MSLPGLTIWCVVSPRGIVGLHFFDRAVAAADYVSVLEGTLPPQTHIRIVMPGPISKTTARSFDRPKRECRAPHIFRNLNTYMVLLLVL